MQTKRMEIIRILLQIIVKNCFSNKTRLKFKKRFLCVCFNDNVYFIIFTQFCSPGTIELPYNMWLSSFILFP